MSATMREPSENAEQIAVIAYLDACRPVVAYFHVPNERKCSARDGAKLKAMGQRRGVPDIIIVTRPPAVPSAPAAYVEMKRRDGGQRSPFQIAWDRLLQANGWAGGFASGAAEAVAMLRRMGYVRPQDQATTPSTARQ
jgi:hypothetical protein